MLNQKLVQPVSKSQNLSRNKQSSGISGVTPKEYQKVKHTKGNTEYTIIKPNKSVDPIIWRNRLMNDAYVPSYLKKNLENLLGQFQLCPANETCNGLSIINQPLTKAEFPEYFDFVKNFKPRLWRKTIRRIANDFIWSANVYIHFILEVGEGGENEFGGIAEIHVYHSGACFPVEIKEGNQITHYAVETKNSTGNGNNYKIIPAYNPKQPRQHAEFIYHIKGETYGCNYFGSSTWLGTGEILKTRKAIEIADLSGIENGFDIRYHIELSKKGIDDIYATACTEAEANNTTKPTRKQIREEILNGIEQTLQGEENAGSNVFTEYEYDDNGNRVAVEIKPMDQVVQNRFDSVSNNINQFGGQAFNAHNSLSGASNSNNLSSGSEIKGAANYIRSLLESDRAYIIEFVEVIAEVEGWYNLESLNDFNLVFIFPDAKLVNTDVNPTGTVPNV